MSSAFYHIHCQAYIIVPAFKSGKANIYSMPFYTLKSSHTVTLRAFLLCRLKCQKRAADCQAYGSYVEHSYPTGPGVCFNPDYLDRRRAPASGPGGCVF